MSPSFNSGVDFALIISLAIDHIFCLAPSIRPPIDPVVSRTKQTSMRGFASLVWVLALSICDQPIAIARVRNVRFFFIVLFGDFINGVVELEQDVLAKRHPWRGLGMSLEKIEIGLGVELNAFPLARVLRVRINPLLAVLEKGAAIHEFRLLGVLQEAIRLRSRGRSSE